MPRKRKTKVQTLRPVINPHAAGADVGAREIYFAVPTALTSEPVRRFATFTEELRRAVEWLRSLGIRTLALEATSVYWIPLAELLEEAGIEVCLVNPRHVKHVPGRKSDVMDCQWLQYLHAVGLLRAAFRPPAQVRGVRALWRERDAWVRQSSWFIQHLHKALDQMNLQVHHVLSDLTGETGLAIVRAILAGERDPAVLARHRDYRVKASEATLRQALTGDYRAEHLFCLAQAFAGYEFIQLQIQKVDTMLERQLKALLPPAPTASDAPPATPPPPAGSAAAVLRSGAKSRKRPSRIAPKFDLQSLLTQLHGVDLCTVPSINTVTALTVWSELGSDLSAFPSVKHFTSWLGLCPDNRITGGKVIAARTRRTANRLATALRLAAESLHHAQNGLGDFYRRMRARLGGAEAVTATAHKLARILYAMIVTRQPYRPDLHDPASERYRARTLTRLQAQAKSMGFHLVETPAPA